MRIYRSNPFDGLGRLPAAPRALAIVGLAAVALGAGGVWAERTVTARGAQTVRAALAAQGFAAAEVSPLRKAGCGRARRLYAWSAGAHAGTACTGPRDRVEITRRG